MLFFSERPTQRRLSDQEDLFLDESITTAEDEGTTMAKENKNDRKMQAIDIAHEPNKVCNKTRYIQSIRNATYTTTTQINRAFGRLLSKKKSVIQIMPRLGQAQLR